MWPHPVVVRTLDAGADKPLPYLPPALEPNPQLGRRGVRLWLARQELWKPQIRALLRAAAVNSNVKVMLPMVAARSEMIAVRRLFAAEAESLGLQVPELGIMVEVPAVAAALGAFKGTTDFVSLGTNDLTQYTAAADRGLEWDIDLSELNPGVLRLIAMVVRDARTMGVQAGVCGELAARPVGAIFLVGVGVSSLSMSANAMEAVVEATSRLGSTRCAEAAQRALESDCGSAALAALSGALAQA
jgi:phosphoenolpyruvate-protein kinase (PTS system EI component)